MLGVLLGTRFGNQFRLRLVMPGVQDTTSGIVTCITGTGYLVRTISESVRTGTYSVQTGTGNLYQYRLVHTGTY